MFNTLIKLRRFPLIGKIAYRLLRYLGLDLPVEVKLGKNVKFPHNSIGTVIHPYTEIKNNVIIYQNVTLGRADIYNTYDKSNMKGIILEDGAIICAGAKVLCKDGVLVIGKNSIIGANCVITKSVEDNEIWAGNPAKFIKNIK